LHQLAVVARKSARAEARVALHGLPVDALASVVTRVVQALVAVNARLAVGGDTLAAGATLVAKKKKKKKKKGKNSGGKERS
jgi:hypothetical protein